MEKMNALNFMNLCKKHLAPLNVTYYVGDELDDTAMWNNALYYAIKKNKPQFLEDLITHYPFQNVKPTLDCYLYDLACNNKNKIKLKEETFTILLNHVNLKKSQVDKCMIYLCKEENFNFLKLLKNKIDTSFEYTNFWENVLYSSVINSKKSNSSFIKKILINKPNYKYSLQITHEISHEINILESSLHNKDDFMCLFNHYENFLSLDNIKSLVKNAINNNNIEALTTIFNHPNNLVFFPLKERNNELIGRSYNTHKNICYVSPQDKEQKVLETLLTLKSHGIYELYSVEKLLSNLIINDKNDLLTKAVEKLELPAHFEKINLISTALSRKKLSALDILLESLSPEQKMSYEKVMLPMIVYEYDKNYKEMLLMKYISSDNMFEYIENNKENNNIIGQYLLTIAMEKSLKSSKPHNSKKFKL